MRTFFGDMWIPFLLGLLLVVCPFLLIKIYSDYKTKSELSKVGVVFAYIIFGLFCMTIINTTHYPKWVFAPDNILYDVFGYIFIVSGIIILAEALFEFNSYKRIFFLTNSGLKADKVISTGVYRFSRNPQYIAYHLLLIGYALPSMSIIPLILILIHIMIIGLIIVPGEEKYLEKILGDEYIQYKKRVRRWL